MSEEGFKRKLSAILSADVEGYSRLMGEDEEATVRTLTAYREVMTTLIQQHNGKVSDSPGDNLLAEFASVVDAVQCAVAVQKEINARNTELPENRKMQFRIGINLGDVIQEKERIYGDGVNIAARLEGLAEPGGICISKTAFDHIESKLPYGYEFLGDQMVKNIAKPVGAYRVLMEPRVTVAGKAEDKKRSPIMRVPILVGTIAVFVVVVAVGIWQYYMRRPTAEHTSMEKMAYPLPDKPSIAVLPFTNMSGDPEQEYFSDGLTEEIITALSKTPKVFVIARHSAFIYKGKPVKVQQVGRELGVRYVLEGSVRKAKDKVRITAQLIDATTEKHLWAERYDRNLREIFAIQDEITLAIIKAMQVELTMGEMADLTGRGTENLDAYLKALQAQEQWWRMDKQGTLKAKQLALEAIAIDRQYGYPYAIVSWSHMMEVWLQSSESQKESMRLAVEAIQKALTLDPSDHRIHCILSNLYIMQGKNDEAIASAQRALELCPGGALAHGVLGTALRFACRFSESVQFREQAIKLDPFPTATAFRNLGMAYLRVGRFGDAIAEYKKALHMNPNDWLIHYSLVETYTKLGRKEEARAQAEELLRIRPNFSLDWLAKTAVKMYAIDCRSKMNDEIEYLRKADVGLK
jgi:adenylate cyclase